ncbi:RT0821/Lpp0805 family surface protein [Aquicella lusitana]|nr:RT0821/Lpp0805 family surface protein [Aquicella lusitana]
MAACSTNTREQNTGIGAVTGAVVGGLAGSAIGSGTGQVVAIGAGAIVGALVGGAIGHSMDSSDNMRATNAMENNPTNKSTHWRNKKSGTRYTVTPVSGRMTVNGNPNCRKYRTSAIIDGKRKTVYGVACRQADGSWQTVRT